MEVQRAQDILRSLSLDDEGSFYGSARGLSVGAGLIYRDVTFPLFNEESGKFQAQSGLVCVLSHECDVDPANVRFLNGMVLVCLILPLRTIVELAEATAFPDGDLGAFLGHVARRRTPRCVYFAPHPDFLPEGGLLNLNLIASTHVSELTEENRVAALSAHAFRAVTASLEDHLTRPKAEILPFSDAPIGHGRSIRDDKSSTG
jgi:hypothetical protein